MLRSSLSSLLILIAFTSSVTAQVLTPKFEFADSVLFSEGRALTNAVADFDNDGDLDLFVGFNGMPNRLYRNDGGRFVDVARSVGVADSNATRSAAWGDFDGDGNLDLFVGIGSRENPFAILYRNEGDGQHFTDVTGAVGVAISGSFRQASWVDYDADGDADLFFALRDKPNVLLRNDGGRFTDVSVAAGVADPRRTVGAVWFDYDEDGDLDLLVANMDGDANGLFRNDVGRFTDVAESAGLADGGRSLGDPESGTVRPALVDFDNDGHLDVFMANYGPNGLFGNLGNGRFENDSEAAGLAIDGRYDTAVFGDYDLDGYEDLYVNGTITGGVSYRDYVFHNESGRFVDVTPPIVLDQEADHGAQWFDFDGDGDLDLALTGSAETGMHQLLRNDTPGSGRGRFLKVLALDARDRYVLAGAEVRLYDSASGRLLGTRIVDTGSGYNAQNAMPVHFGLAQAGPVDVELTTLTGSGRRVKRVENVNPIEFFGKAFVIRSDAR